MQTLLKSAEILDINVKEGGSKMPPDCKEAVIRGREALVRLHHLRILHVPLAEKLLPSEIRGVL